MRPTVTTLSLMALLFASSPARAVNLVITYDVSAPFTLAEEAVINEAAALWEAEIAGPDIVAVLLRKVPLASTRLGWASSLTAPGPSNSGRPVSGTIEINSMIPFFVDPTPGDHSEFLQNVSPPTLRPAVPLGPADGFYDLLTLALHEFGHVLGFSSAFADFSTHITPSPDTTQFVFVFGAPPTFGDAVVEYFAPTFFTNGGVYMPSVEEDSEEGGSTGGLPSHTDNISSAGTAAGTFIPYLMAPTQNLSERVLVARIPEVDMLVDAYAYTVPLPIPALAPLHLFLLAGALLIACAGTLKHYSRPIGG